MKSFVTCTPLGRMGNSLFSAAAAIAYAARHGLQFSMPSVTPNPVWKALYLQHLVHPDYNPELPRIILAEDGFPYQPLPFDPAWAEDHVIVVDGYRQSEKYFADYREEVLAAFGFPWELRKGWCAVHVRRSDYLIHKTKHPAVEPEWYLSQMSKIVQLMRPEPVKFLFLTDDIDYCRATFGYLGSAYFASKFEAPDWFHGIEKERPEVRDLIFGSQCAHVVGSASTFAVWMGLLGRNPGRKVIIPRDWICEGWQGTTADDWRDIIPTGPGWERA